jgi:probable F420-dependent oxidoreductase
MRFGVPLPQFGPLAAAPDVAARIAAVATAADRLGYHVLWTAEHLILPWEIRTPYPYGARYPFAVTDPILDVTSTLSWVAALTRHVRLSCSVMVLPYRHPVVLAKELATLDVLSGGRVLVGVASGWLAEEFAMLGVPFRERGARMDEYLDVLRLLWTEERPTFHGRFVQLEDAAFFPKPVQKPHPPIWIGGGHAAFPRIVRAGDGWIAAPRGTLEELESDIAVLRALAERAGRDPATIGIATGGAARDLSGLLERLPALERAGVTIVSVPAIFWAQSSGHAVELLEEFAARAGLRAPAAS